MQFLPVDRVAIRSHIRNQLRARRQIEFCDDGPYEGPSVTAAIWKRQAEVYNESLLAAGVAASSTDHDLQSIGNTLEYDASFWSSTGSNTSQASEYLLYRLSVPAARLRFVKVAVYRAAYQHGDPMYPPAQFSFLVGPSPRQLVPASPVYTCAMTDQAQVFALNHDVPPASYLMVLLHGKLQQQLEDMRYYHAIRWVAAFGDVLPLHQLPSITSVMRSGQLACNASWSAAGVQRALLPPHAQPSTHSSSTPAAGHQAPPVLSPPDQPGHPPRQGSIAAGTLALGAQSLQGTGSVAPGPTGWLGSAVQGRSNTCRVSRHAHAAHSHQQQSVQQRWSTRNSPHGRSSGDDGGDEEEGEEEVLWVADEQPGGSLSFRRQEQGQEQRQRSTSQAGTAGKGSTEAGGSEGGPSPPQPGGGLLGTMRRLGSSVRAAVFGGHQGGEGAAPAQQQQQQQQQPHPPTSAAAVAALFTYVISRIRQRAGREEPGGGGGGFDGPEGGLLPVEVLARQLQEDPALMHDPYLIQQMLLIQEEMAAEEEEEGMEVEGHDQLDQEEAAAHVQGRQDQWMADDEVPPAQSPQEQKVMGQQQLLDVLFDRVPCPHPEDGVPCWHVSDLDIEHLLTS